MIKRALAHYKLPLMIMVRPFAGFYSMKFEHQGTMRLAILNLVLVCIAYAFSNQYASLLVDARHPLNVNSLTDVLFLLAALFLFCIANWSVTSLTDGEGRFKDIFMAVCYAMTPLIITIVPATIISNFLAAEETGLFYILMTVGMTYFILLVFAGLVTVHNYGAIKALLTVLLTFVSILIIVFLATLLFTLWQQLYSFIYSLYIELSFR
jgi:hypothetical protein